MEIPDFVDQLLRLKERDIELRTWELWLALRPRMTEDNFVSYEEMLATTKQQEVKQDVVTNGVYVDQAFF